MRRARAAPASPIPPPKDDPGVGADPRPDLDRPGSESPDGPTASLAMDTWERGDSRHPQAVQRTSTTRATFETTPDPTTLHNVMRLAYADDAAAAGPVHRGFRHSEAIASGRARTSHDRSRPVGPFHHLPGGSPVWSAARTSIGTPPPWEPRAESMSDHDASWPS